jgi:hypothetical protein
MDEEMQANEIFDSCVRSADDLAGVFEYDGETGYFYLYETSGDEGQKVRDSIHILSGEPDFGEAEISIRWDEKEQKVGLLIKGVLWAVFDAQHHAKYGGSYRPGAKPLLPSEALAGF